MSLAAALWGEARDTAERCLAHPFVRGLGDGTLPRERYRDFIAQDAFFLEVFARGYAHCLATAPDRDGLYACHRLLNGVFEELELHARAAEELQIDLARVHPAPATLAYTGFLEACIGAGASVGETLAAMTPCMRLYAYLGRRLAEGPAAAPYRDWVQAYASDDFQGLATLLEELLDRYGTSEGGRERERYHRAMELEYGFFDAAWTGSGIAS